jgi:hypothetical protein
MKIRWMPTLVGIVLFALFLLICVRFVTAYETDVRAQTRLSVLQRRITLGLPVGQVKARILASGLTYDSDGVWDHQKQIDLEALYVTVLGGDAVFQEYYRLIFVFDERHLLREIRKDNAADGL